MVLLFESYSYSGEDISSDENLPFLYPCFLGVPVSLAALPHTARHPSSLQLSRKSQNVNISCRFTDWGLETHPLDGERCDLVPKLRYPGAVEAELQVSRQIGMSAYST